MRLLRKSLADAMFESNEMRMLSTAAHSQAECCQTYLCAVCKRAF